MTTSLPALEGGTPVRSKPPVPFYRIDLSDDDVRAVTDTLRGGWLTLGPRTGEFEHACAAYVGSSYATALNSCTSALFVALAAHGIGSGDEVIVPALTFAATVNTVRHTGAEPVLADIELPSAGLDPVEVESLITPRTRAVVAVDYAGHPCRIAELLEVTRRRKLVFIEDAAHAFGARYRGRPVGAWSDMTAFSFYATKCITTGEGGLLTCQDADTDARVRLLSYHGMARDAWKRYSDRGSWYYEVALPGYKFNMTDLQAALGLSQLSRADLLRDARQRIAQQYSAAFADLEGLQLPSQQDDVVHAWHLYVVRLRTDSLRVGRDHFGRALRDEGLVPSMHFIPYHRQPVGRDLALRRSLARTEDFADRCLSLPLFPTMTADEVQDVITAVRKLVRYYTR